MYLVRAAELAIESNRNLRFILFGEGPDWDNVKAYIETRSLSKFIICPGFEPELLSYLKSADALVNPSLSEGLPNIVLEALAAKVPVIVTNVGGHPEIVIDNFNGYLVEPKHIGQMAERIGELSRNESKQESDPHFSISTSPFPKAEMASDRAEASAAPKASCASTRRMPLPPPPATALIMTG